MRRRLGVIGVIAIAALGVVIALALNGGGGSDGQVPEGSRACAQGQDGVAPPSQPIGAESVGAQRIEIVEQGCTEIQGNGEDREWSVSYGAAIKNNSPSETASGVKMEVTLSDANGVVVASEAGSVGRLSPGQSGALGNDTEPSLPAGSAPTRLVSPLHMTVKTSVESWETAQGSPGALTPEGVTLETDSDYVCGVGPGGEDLAPCFAPATHVRGELASSFAEDLKDVAVVAILRDDSNAVVGGATTTVFIPAGGRVAFEAVTEQLRRATSAEVIANPSSARPAPGSGVAEPGLGAVDVEALKQDTSGALGILASAGVPLSQTVAPAAWDAANFGSLGEILRQVGITPLGGAFSSFASPSDPLKTLSFMALQFANSADATTAANAMRGMLEPLLNDLPDNELGSHGAFALQGTEPYGAVEGTGDRGPGIDRGLIANLDGEPLGDFSGTGLLYEAGVLYQKGNTVYLSTAITQELIYPLIDVLRQAAEAR